MPSPWYNCRWELWAPRNVDRSTAGQRVQEGWNREWTGYGTFKELSTRTSTRELGMAAQLTATARSRAIPAALHAKIVIGSWRARSPDGRWYEVKNRTRSGNLTTLSLTEAQDQRGADS